MSAKYNLVCDQATTFNFQFVIKNDSTPWDLTGYSGVMTIRPFSNSTTTTLVASTANGSMSLMRSMAESMSSLQLLKLTLLQAVMSMTWCLHLVQLLPES